MAPFPWLVMLESLAYQQLMKSPTFHRGVEQVVKTVHRVRHGIPPDELGGTKIDEPTSRFGQHFYDEIRSQLGTVEKEQAKGTRLESPNKNETRPSPTQVAEDAESAWQELQQGSSQQPPKKAFMDNYLETLRGQVNQKKPPP